jgi:hypothetical protein
MLGSDSRRQLLANAAIAASRSRASACGLHDAQKASVHSQGVPSGASLSPWRSAFARTDLLRSLVSTQRWTRWVSADLGQLLVRHAVSRAVAPSWTALAATALTLALSQRFARLIQCDWRSCKHQKRDAYSKLRARGERPRNCRAAECGQQFPPSDGDCHTPLPREVRKGKDTTPSACSLHVREGGDAAAFGLGPL